MPTWDNDDAALRLASNVTLAPLPFGGAVLIDGTTLALIECGEADAALLHALLAHGVPAPGGGPADEAARRTATELMRAGWIEPAPTTDRR